MSRPTVTIVFLAFNRRDELRESLRRMTTESDYPRDRVDLIVVDNASTDGSAAMVRDEFPQMRLIERQTNVGVSGWNDGLAEAGGDYVLVLDDDCYLPPDGLTRAVQAAEARHADLVSFSVASTHDPAYLFSEKYRTGLLSFWGCAWLIRRSALDTLGGFDPEIFIWANELEFMLRFFDRGYRHLHLPEVVAQHMKPPRDADAPMDLRGSKINARHFAYIAGKLLHPRDAAEALVALLARQVRDGLLDYPVVLRALPDTLLGFVHGLRNRDPVRNAEVSRAFRRNFESFASPWWVARPVGELVRKLPAELILRRRAPVDGEAQARVFRRAGAVLSAGSADA